MRLAIIVVAGCGRIGFATTAPDADVPLGPFSPPIAISDLSLVNTDDPALSRDELEIYFTVTTGACEILHATRATLDATWSMPIVVPVIDDPAQCDSTPEIADDGLTIWFSSMRLSYHELFEATRPTTDAPWSMPIHLGQLGTPAPTDDYAPSVTADGLTMFFNSNRGANHDLYVSTRASTTDAWSAPAIVAELSSAQFNERSPHVEPDGLALWFVSDRDGRPLIEVARRGSTQTPFDPPERVPELASSLGEDDPWLSPDGRRIYFSRILAGGSRLYVASR